MIFFSLGREFFRNHRNSKVSNSKLMAPQWTSTPSTEMGEEAASTESSLFDIASFYPTAGSQLQTNLFDSTTCFSIEDPKEVHQLQWQSEEKDSGSCGLEAFNHTNCCSPIAGNCDLPDGPAVRSVTHLHPISIPEPSSDDPVTQDCVGQLPVTSPGNPYFRKLYHGGESTAKDCGGQVLMLQSSCCHSQRPLVDPGRTPHQPTLSRIDEEEEDETQRIPTIGSSLVMTSAFDCRSGSDSSSLSHSSLSSAMSSSLTSNALSHSSLTSNAMNSSITIDRHLGVVSPAMTGYSATSAFCSPNTSSLVPVSLFTATPSTMATQFSHQQSSTEVSGRTDFCGGFYPSANATSSSSSCSSTPFMMVSQRNSNPGFQQGYMSYMLDQLCSRIDTDSTEGQHSTIPLMPFRRHSSFVADTVPCYQLSADASPVCSTTSEPSGTLNPSFLEEQSANDDATLKADEDDDDEYNDNDDENDGDFILKRTSSFRQRDGRRNRSTASTQSPSAAPLSPPSDLATSPLFPLNSSTPQQVSVPPVRRGRKARSNSLTAVEALKAFPSGVTKKRRKSANQPQLPKTIKCTVSGCSKMFNRGEHLVRHLRMHTGERPFKCEIEGCDKYFSRSDNMAAHVKAHRRMLEREANRNYSSSSSSSETQHSKTIVPSSGRRRKRSI